MNKSMFTTGVEDRENGVFLSPFPAGLRVLLVDDDSTCLLIVERLLQACCYEVTKCQRASDALTLLRESKGKIDIVLCDIYMPGMNGFQLLEIIRSEMDLPVVIMSNDDRRDVVMKVIQMGASAYIVKPVRKEEISVMWQHVVRKQKNESKPLMFSKIKPSTEEYHNGSTPEENCGSSNHGKNEEEEGYKTDIISLKKPRMVWTSELHEQFVAVVNHVGLKNAVPKKILELMKVPGLTRENVASHLQKYRIHLRRKSENTPNKFNNLPVHFQNALHPTSMGSYNLQAYAMSNQLQSQSSIVSQVEPERASTVICAPMDQRSCYDQRLSESVMDTVQDSWCYSRQVNQPHGSETTVEPEQERFTVTQPMHKDQSLNESGTYYHVPVPSALIDVTNHQATKFSVYECSPEGTQNASFGSSRNNSEYNLCSNYAPLYAAEQHYDQEDLI